MGRQYFSIYCTCYYGGAVPIFIKRTLLGNDNRISSDIEALNYFQGAPKDIIKIAKEETLQYLLEEVNGTVVPLITTAIWGDETTLLSIDTLEELYKNGGEILKRQLMDTHSAIQSWREYYEMNEEQVNLLENLYE